jgi:phytanoyl-CoA hydroxylase
MFDGHLDRVEAGWVLGWAWRSDRPHERQDVEVYLDVTKVATGRAERYRADLQRAGKGDGCCAFEIPLPTALRNGAQLRVVFAGTRIELPGSPIAISGAAAADEYDIIPPPDGARYRSRFGGLWPDLSSALEIVAEKESRQIVSAEEAAPLRRWIAYGFVVLPSAVDPVIIDLLDAEVEVIWDGVSRHRCFVEYWEGDVATVQPAGPKFKDVPVKLLDLYAHLENARKIVFAPAIRRFLTLVFEQPSVAFQSLYFRWGSRQDIHQDTAFVKVSSPMRLVASWVALEDIQPDSGELEYYVGSHTLEDYLFDGRHKWMPFRSTEYQQYVASLHARSQAGGFERQRFRPRKGDVLIWSADLAHGGSRDISRAVTRKSLVPHSCPADCQPVYSGDGVAPTRHPFDEAAFYTVPRRD